MTSVISPALNPVQDLFPRDADRPFPLEVIKATIKLVTLGRGHGNGLRGPS